MARTAKAQLYEVGDGAENTKIPKVTAQFNPETLRITYGAQVALTQSKTASPTAASGQGDQPGSTPHQRTGPGSKRLSVQLWFDVTAVLPQDAENVSDVRELTERVAYFINEKKPPSGNGPAEAPPLVRFQWGTLNFTGVMDSLDESLEFFSTEGVPLRASMNIGISQGEVLSPPERSGGSTAGLNLSAGIGIGVSASLGAGTQPLAQAEAGVSLQAMASASFGGEADWQSIASANGIENPRLLQPGQLINMNARASSSASASGSASASFSLTGE
ncbi:MAG: hypothetical protein QOH41_60 [Blastocatellia bacterium]|jgi:hypothetical protein|nr:hypothetical protein [Blastocatellia bacterium]